MLGFMRGVRHERQHSGGFRAEPPAAELIGAVAEGQHGNVSLEQLRACGASAAAAQARVRRGHWRRMHKCVYFIGRGPITLRARWMAAVLACGPTAVLSHRSAAALHGLRAENRAKTDVSVPSKSIRQRRGIEVHAAGSLTAEDITDIYNIPCTTLPRTVFDLAETVDRRAVLLAIDRAELLRTFDRRDFDAALARASGHRGAAVVQSILDEYHGPSDGAENPLLDHFLVLCGRAGVRHPELEAAIELEDGPIHVDCLWRAERVAVELDSRANHDSARGFDNDRDRDQQLVLAGFIPIRFSWRHVHAQATRTERRLCELLATGRARARISELRQPFEATR